MSALPGHDPAAIQAAAQRLAEGGLLGLPTETVYGLAARADQDAAVAKIFAAKGRPSDHPLIVHVLDAAGAEPFAEHLPDAARRLMDAFWPGPLTVIVPRRAGMAEAAAGGHATVAVRSPAHPVARAVLAAARELGVQGVAAPSANRFGRVSPTLARHVVDEFGAGLMVLDGGACEVGIESSIVDCSRERPALLRPGLLNRARIEAVLGQPLADPDAAAPRASGTLAAHYAPSARVRLLDAAALALRLATAAASGGLEGVTRPAAGRGGLHMAGHAGRSGRGGARVVRRAAGAGRGWRARNLGRGSAARPGLGWRAGPAQPGRRRLHRLSLFLFLS
jgi:L-threonylcarbamoyladenylate synthase